MVSRQTRASGLLHQLSRARPCCCFRGAHAARQSQHRSRMFDRRSVVNIARRVQSRHSYPFSLLITSGRISLKQRNEQVDYRYMFYLSSATRWAVSWVGDDMTQTSVVDNISPARCRVLPWRCLAEKGSPHSRKIFSKCIENTQYNLFPGLDGIYSYNCRN